MKQFCTLISVAAAALALVPPTMAGEALVNHQLVVHLDPEAHSLRVSDRIDLVGLTPAEDGALYFVLHAGLKPDVQSPGWRLDPAPPQAETEFLGLNASTETLANQAPQAAWRLLPPEGSPDPPVVELTYAGEIYHALATQGEEYQRSFSETPGLISEDGVFLAGTSFWVPTFGDPLVTFELEVTGLTPPWDALSQGRRTVHETSPEGTRITTWSCEQPTEEIYLVAAPWHEYRDSAGEVEIFVFLRQADPGLARRYLDATKRYRKLYEAILPPYPYPSFVMAENFWDTGYGMPGFTLLGPKVIRFPWILTSSYPHELLHNWWGNSVYVDYEHGNWCEGLTAYMADHLFAEQRGEAVTYRRTTLKKYTDFVAIDSDRDFALVDFHSRHSAASEAVGYGKSLMLFHMIRRAVGDEAFLGALSRFFADHRFTRTTFAAIAEALDQETGSDWSAFVNTWTTRSGAPRLEITTAKVRQPSAQGGPWLLDLVIRQVQPEPAFPITVPVAVGVAGQEEPVWAMAGPCARDCAVTIRCPGKPLRLDVDPAFDVMRCLDPREVPPAFSTIFGASDPLFVLPAAAPKAELEAWSALVASWVPEGARTVLDRELDGLPPGPAWLLGRSNLLGRQVAAGLTSHGVALSDDTFTVAGETLSLAEHSLVLVGRDPGDPAKAIAWIAADPAAAIPGLARKLPHYTRYSYLAFRGDEPENVAKGLWSASGSPLVVLFDEEHLPLHLPSRPPLAELPAVFDAGALQASVDYLASEQLGGRGLGSDGLAQATSWVAARFAEIGLQGAFDGTFRQTWSWTGGAPRTSRAGVAPRTSRAEGAPEREMELVNLLGKVPGTDPQLASEPVLVMAHLDHLGRGWPDVRSGNQGKVHPGADDNASGVAVLLELARTMVGEPRPRPVLFAVVTGEEAGLLGSRHLLADPRVGPFACVNLDTVGRLGDGKLMVLNSDSAREWRFIFMGVGYTTGAAIAIVSEPLDSSDQLACLEQGIPAVQLFSGPHGDYHRPTDTAAKIDSQGMATVTEAVYQAVAYLAERKEPLTVTIAGGPSSATPAPSRQPASGRRVSLGTMPDFTFSGPGVRVQQVMPDSAAAAAGLRAGDVLLAIDEAEIASLRGFSDILKAHQPGDAVLVRISRDGEEQTVRAILKAR